MTGDIDFVLPWVDGADAVWQAECARWRAEQPCRAVDSCFNEGAMRYRDWDLLRYWFRGVEKFTPWVRAVHFVTCGHLPPWLDVRHPKLHVVRHDEYIPPEYLPTFSSHCIELNLHRIKGLSEHFVYFNDDTFVVRPMTEDDFFRKGLPRDAGVMTPVYLERTGVRAEINDLYVINAHFGKNAVIAARPFNWFTPVYGKYLIRNFLMMPFRLFPSFYIAHNPSSFLKSTFEEVWQQEFETLDETCRHRFRQSTDVNQWLMSYWQLAQNRFVPRSPGVGAFYQGAAQCASACAAIRRQRTKFLCWNDGVDIGDDFAVLQRKLHDAFESILPEKSSFET